MKGLTSQALSRFLSLAESTKTEKEFFRFMVESQELDPENFACHGRSLFGENFVLILGQHAKQRSSNRALLSETMLLDLIDSHLDNPLVLSQILSSRICYDEDTDGIVGFDDPDVEAIAVVTDDSNYIVVYEAGFRYVRVKTIWDKRDGKFFVNHLTKPIKVIKGNGIVTNIESITEIALNTRGR